MSTSVIVAVGSKNPAKIEAARNGISRAINCNSSDTGDVTTVSVFGYNVPSGVADQPLGDEECVRGALNRARLAFAAHKESHNGAAPDFAIGLEGAVTFKENQPTECFAWMAIVNDTATVGTAKTATFMLPPAITKLMQEQGMELGAADDAVFGSTNNKQKGGSVGHMTRGVIGRAEYYEHAVVMAFIPFQWPELYGGAESAVQT